MVRGDDNEPWSTQADVVCRDAKTTAWINGRWWINNPGGVIVVPNEHVEDLYAIDRELAGDIHETARQMHWRCGRPFGVRGRRRGSTTSPAGCKRSGTTTCTCFRAGSVTGSTARTRG
jgi:histidine triad (HIT) family protein